MENCVSKLPWDPDTNRSNFSAGGTIPRAGTVGGVGMPLAVGMMGGQFNMAAFSSMAVQSPFPPGPASFASPHGISPGVKTGDSPPSSKRRKASAPSPSKSADSSVDGTSSAGGDGDHNGDLAADGSDDAGIRNDSSTGHIDGNKSFVSPFAPLVGASIQVRIIDVSNSLYIHFTLKQRKRWLMLYLCNGQLKIPVTEMVLDQLTVEDIQSRAGVTAQILDKEEGTILPLLKLFFEISCSTV